MSRLGRPAHAHPLRLRRRGYTPEAIRDFCERIGVAKRGQHGGHRPARVLPAGGPEPARPAGDGGAAAAQGDDRQLPRGSGGGARGGQQPGGPRGRARARCPSAGSSTSSARTSWRTRPRSSSAWRRAARCACATPISSRCDGGGQGPANGRGGGAALHLRPGDPRRRRPGRPQGQGDPALGVGRPRRAPPRCGSTSTSSPRRTRRRSPRAGTSPTTSTPSPSRCSRTAAWSPGLAAAAPGSRFQFERLGYFCADARDSRRATGLQPHRDPARHLGEDRKEGGGGEEKGVS